MHHVEVVTQLEPAHLEQLPQLLEAATHADGHEPIGEHKFLRLKRGEDLAVALLAYEEGRLEGYAHTVTYGAPEHRRVSCEFVVHPAQRGRGIGHQLVTRAVEHARSQQARRMDLWAYNDSPASASIAHDFGFAPVRRLLHLHRHVHELPRPQALEGAGIRPFVPGRDEPAWLELNNRVFAGHPENGNWTREDLDARLTQPWFRAEDLLMLEVNRGLAGFCWLKVEERGEQGLVGEIYIIGTAPEARGLGLGRYLLAHALTHLRARGVGTAAIYVDESNEPAVALYETNGFHHHHVDVCYSRELAAGEAPERAEHAA